MIATLYGTIFSMDPVNCIVILECCGVGYRVQVSAGTLSRLPSPAYQPDGSEARGESVRLYTYMAVREDSVDLFGFYTAEEQDMFKLLLTVSGVGPKAAMSILSLMTPRTLAMTIAAEDTKSISKAPGVGAKTAARVVLELKDKLSKLYPETGGIPEIADIPTAGKSAAKSSKLSDARDALLVLGYSRSEITAAMKDINMEDSLEEIIKKALAKLMV
ncbi:MAG: Holliday junction branch migration protein RuvA [Clostridia bacterium]|nr:Holliday junction branch migration protein RuvA [Clostridia bacterium]